ncbi:MAG: hypothetical protein RIS54_275 [Verrucomicrobiota bacterium]|jgi:hypothetical protein
MQSAIPLKLVLIEDQALLRQSVAASLRVHQQAERAGNPPLPPTAFGSTPPAR